MVVALLAVTIACAVALILGWWRCRTREGAWRPPALKGARLVYAEKVFATRTPFPLVAKVDRGYLVADMIVLAELKTRPTVTVYRSDIIELSAQRLAIEAATEWPVSDTAYVVVQNPITGRRIPSEVRLLPAAELVSMARRLEGLRAGGTTPTRTDRPSLCLRCAFNRRCRPSRETQLQSTS